MLSYILFCYFIANPIMLKVITAVLGPLKNNICLPDNPE
jgi:hypothetical protein